MRLSKMISAVDVHACGEPGRVITGGVLDVPGKTMFEKKTYLETEADDLRKLMRREPRGYPALCCNLILPPTNPRADAKNTVIVSTGTPDWDKPSSWTGVLDRSPCGTGTCARMAVLHAKGALPLQQDFVHESILGTLFTGRLIAETQVGPYRAVVPTISGRAWISGFANYVVDAEDPFPTGFTVGDLWGLNEIGG